jgi:hypothetical protein
MRFLSSIRIVRVSLALAVALWMAGAGCLLGCERMTVAASRETAPPAVAAGVVVAGEACASTSMSTSMQSHDCCARRSHAASKAVAKTRSSSYQSQFETVSRRQIPAETKENLTVIENTSSRELELGATFPTMMDCPLVVNATAVLSKAGADDSTIALRTSGESDPLTNLTEQTNVQGRPLRLPNRGHTYLRCCVFLI